MSEDYWFFLSHARRDALGEDYLPRFFEDLSLRVAQLAGLPSNTAGPQVGYCDFDSLEPGDHWPDDLAEGLQASRTLVCLYSPAYFNSAWCGRELRVFLERVAAAGQPPDVVLPVLWEGAERLPEVLPRELAPIQYLRADYGPEYERGGVHWLMSLDANRDAYRTFIDRFAALLVEQARPASLPRLAQMPPPDEVGGAFADATGIGASSTSFGPGTGVFVYVAATDEEARQVRSNIGAYGPSGGRDWRPWVPDAPRAVGVIAQAAASLENLFYETLPVDEALVEKLRAAEAANAIVLFVVDPWSLRLEPYRSRMKAFDESTFVNCGVLIPWNEADDETAGARTPLTSEVRQALSRGYVLSTTYLRDEIRSAEELQQILIDAISELRRRILLHADVVQPVDTSMPLPAVSGPGRPAP